MLESWCNLTVCGNVTQRGGARVCACKRLATGVDHSDAGGHVAHCLALSSSSYKYIPLLSDWLRLKPYHITPALSLCRSYSSFLLIQNLPVLRPSWQTKTDSRPYRKKLKTRTRTSSRTTTNRSSMSSSKTLLSHRLPSIGNSRSARRAPHYRHQPPKTFRDGFLTGHGVGEGQQVLECAGASSQW